MTGVVLFILSLVVALIVASIRIFREYERGVIFTLGRFTSIKGPGIALVIPVLQQSERVGLRIVALDVPSQDLITRDNVSIKVNAVVYYRIVAPEKAVIQVEDYIAAVSELSQTTLRAVLGEHDLDSLLSERNKLNSDLQGVLDERTDAWGIKVENVEIKHVDLDQTMIRAIARQAEAERERRAKIIHAEGERQSAEMLKDAAITLAKAPGSMQLRYLQTLVDISSERSNTIVFPLEIGNIIKQLSDKK
ncbi:MAG: slipin family protein [Candidatus Porifericomitaceae bacterium WSBS_2022_MAG_OTU9]